MRPAYEALRSRHFGGEESSLKYNLSRQLRVEAEGRRARQKEHDRRHQNSTALRKGRISRLRDLCESAPVCDGAAVPALAWEDGGGAEGGEQEGSGTSYMLQVPDGAVKEETIASCEKGGDSMLGDVDNGTSGKGELYKSRQCYTCKVRFTSLHHFYALLCPTCAELNYRMRCFSVDMQGRVALLTGARVKIGFEIGLKLLRAGATLIATSRFIADAAQRYAREPDFNDWRHRLQFHALDLRDAAALESFCAFLLTHLPRLDVVINNACQTIRRPAAYYRHLLPAERAAHRALLASAGKKTQALQCVSDVSGEGADECSAPKSQNQEQDPILPLLAQHAARMRQAAQPNGAPPALTCNGSEAADAPSSPGEMPSPGEAAVAELSQLALLPEDVGSGDGALPTGALDVNGQQIDLRRVTTWVQPLQAVSTAEAAEVLAINTLAPFTLNARLHPLLAATAKMGPPSGGSDAGASFIVNVSAMEGKFYRHKTPNHPHTNMAKAALNMMTRTSAAELAKQDRIFMTAVDTGWINDENPRHAAEANARNHDFQTPLDEVDAAARVLHPVFDGLSTGSPKFGVFLKDYAESEW
eukprot:TRINITY_DN2860_c3_g2_i1.p1 TRINITY_DN2860_c3_g2~~TRINITY_DN2860_c3_g2_i1.p1  ORF type:complete len:683 (-),score=158.64 TRINITY_DN2860_c3_g2_i1:296-2056(-)